MDSLSTDKYQVVRELGVGAFGQVMLAVDRQTGEEVAIKYMERGSQVTKYVEREIMIHSQLSHPHVVEFREVFLTDKHLGIVMEYCAGGDLFTYVIAHRGLHEKPARWFFQQFMLGLDYCHRMGIVSRDVKLENTLLDGGNPPMLKICDFGYAKSEVEHSKPKTKVGTPGYTAPEVLKNSSLGGYDGKLADIWSAGVMLYSMLFARYPFERPEDAQMNEFEKVQAVLKRILAVDYTIPGDISAECKDLLEKIMVADPGQRITISNIYKHPWFSQDLPEGIEFFNDDIISQPIERIQSPDQIQATIQAAQVSTTSALASYSDYGDDEDDFDLTFDNPDY